MPRFLPTIIPIRSNHFPFRPTRSPAPPLLFRKQMANKSDTARINGSKSRGPVTPEGKAKSSRNALRHGLTAGFAVLPHEDKSDFEQLLDALIARYQPADEPEMELVHAMAVARWRLRRIGTLESCLFDNELGALAGRYRRRVRRNQRLRPPLLRLPQAGRVRPLLELLMRYEASLMRVYERTLKQLEHLQDRPLPNEPTSSIDPDSPTTSLPSDPEPSAVPHDADPTRAHPEQVRSHTHAGKPSILHVCGTSSV